MQSDVTPGPRLQVAENLGTVWKKGVPIEVIPMAIAPVTLKMKSMGGEPTLRMAKAKAGPVISGRLRKFELDPRTRLGSPWHGGIY